MQSFTTVDIENYCIGKSATPSNLCNDLEAFTRKNVQLSQMLIGKLEASLLGFLIRSIDAKNILEIGTFTGYSALAMAENLPPDGTITTLDVNRETVGIGKSYWEQSPHGKKINSVIGPALIAMEEFIKTSRKFDFIFIDADKNNYLNYLKMSLELISPKGIIALDNCIWSGAVLEEKPTEDTTKSIQAVNNFVEKEINLYGTLLPVRDGVFLVKKLS